jgi:hypothetical protein
VNQEGRQPALNDDRRDVILSAIDETVAVGAVTRLAGGRSSRTVERILVTIRSGTRQVILKRFPADRDGAAAEWRSLGAIEQFPVPARRRNRP